MPDFLVHSQFYRRPSEAIRIVPHLPARRRANVPSGDKLPLKLTAAQRKLILEGLFCLDQEYEQALRQTPAGEPLMMTLDDLDDFGGYIAAEANHCKDKKKQKAQGRIFDKIQHLLDTYADQEPAKTVKIDWRRMG